MIDYVAVKSVEKSRRKKVLNEVIRYILLKSVVRSGYSTT